MPLIKCPECGKEISSAAAACPNCGHPAALVETPRQPATPPPKSNRIGTVQGLLMIVGASVVGCLVMFNAELGGGNDGSFDRMAKAESALKSRLYDPGSYQQIDSKTYQRNGGGYSVVIHYRAKNGFGGFTDDYMTFNFDARNNLVP